MSSKLQNLTATTTPVSTDIAYTVVDPTGTPVDRNATWSDISKALVASNIPNAAVTNAVNAFTAAQNEAKGGDIASAATTDIGAATGNFVFVTGTTTITALGTVQSGTKRVVKFTGILILTQNATSLILPTAANITTAVDDRAEFISLGSGNWICTNYLRADGTALAAAEGGFTSAARAFISSNQSIATATATKITFNSETFDNDGEFDSTTNNRFVASGTGKFSVNAGTRWFDFINTGVITKIHIYKNGSVFSTVEYKAGTSTNNTNQISDIVPLVDTDFIEIFIEHAHGSNRNINAGSTLTWVSISQVST